MTANALAVREEQQLTNTPVMSTAPTLDRENLQFFANMIEAAGLIPTVNGIPPHIQKSRVMAKIVAGTYWGFDPISSQTNLDVINHRLVLNSHGQRQLLHRGGNYTTRQEYLNDDGCKLIVLKKNARGDWTKIGEVEFTRAMAEKAGLLKKNGDMYGKFGPDMYFARCITRVVGRFAPEVLDGQHINYNLAKQAPAPVEPQDNVRQIEEKRPETAEVYQDEPYTEEFTGMEDLEAEFTPVDPEESLRADLITAARDWLQDQTKGDVGEIKKIMKGRNFENMTTDELKFFVSGE